MSGRSVLPGVTPFTDQPKPTSDDRVKTGHRSGLAHSLLGVGVVGMWAGAVEALRHGPETWETLAGAAAK